ncbi:Kinesin motor domain [Carpediemonas membranifera]|uniref:Kinesin-like protein n=1 Tax=Carpediemonas membranifera TaxID=201153 RepID=A0A8J6E0F9_9EUKA|nr:Kinesin motor domain [Carpediemonas membranifera]|eukprot:KAG9391796.1 Kinesin motor domain [Carpediemonas membranifera]
MLKLRTAEQEQQRNYINNKKKSYQFKFANIFEPTAKQDFVYNMTARKCVEDVLEGFNATVFAYGQTGSGKTYTMTGGNGEYALRGIIPRCIEHIFERLGSAADNTEVWVTYLQVYLGKGYDLLGGDISSSYQSTLDDLPRFTLREDANGVKHADLSRHVVRNKSEALLKLFDGDSNRVVAATAMNDASSRSHCVFTLGIRQKLAGSGAYRVAKLNLVDLAGSERVSKTQAEGEVLNEACYINGSLFHLERVINTLSQNQGKRPDKRAHVPYRGSLITSLLQDSLGGNSRTIMIATLSGDPANFGETVSTCKFSMRVGSIQNTAVVNEETDLKIVLKKLRTENGVLRRQLKSLREGNGKPAMPQSQAKTQAQADVSIDEVKAKNANAARIIRQRQAEIAVLTDMLSEVMPGVGEPGQEIATAPAGSSLLPSRSGTAESVRHVVSPKPDTDAMMAISTVPLEQVPPALLSSTDTGSRRELLRLFMTGYTIDPAYPTQHAYVKDRVPAVKAMGAEYKQIAAQRTKLLGAEPVDMAAVAAAEARMRELQQALAQEKPRIEVALKAVNAEKARWAADFERWAGLAAATLR